jgi:uncharacterized protein YbjT (DUF2867 family)
MRVLGTGGMGRVGQAVVKDPLEHGYEVVSAHQQAAPRGRSPGAVRFAEKRSFGYASG